MANLKLAVRMLPKTQVVTSVAVLSLALGIGSNAAIFSLFNQILLRPLPVEEPERLVNLEAPGPKPGSDNCNQAGGCDEVFSYPMYRDLRHAQTVFTDIAIREGQLPGLRDVERELDQDGDGSVRIGELFAWSLDEDPRVAEFLGQVAAELQLGAGGEDAVSLLLPAVQAGAEPPVFDYATLRTLTRDAVHDWWAEAWLVFWLRYAEWAVSRGDVDAESFAVGRYLRRLEPELLRSATITDGTPLEQILLATATEAPQPPRHPGRRSVLLAMKQSRPECRGARMARSRSGRIPGAFDR